MQVIYDNGGELTGFAVQQLLQLLNTKLVPTQIKIHILIILQVYTFASVMKILLLAQPLQIHHQTAMLVDDALAIVMHAMHSIVSTMLQAMPGGLELS